MAYVYGSFARMLDQNRGNKHIENPCHLANLQIDLIPPPPPYFCNSISAGILRAHLVYEYLFLEHQILNTTVYKIKVKATMLRVFHGNQVPIDERKAISKQTVLESLHTLNPSL